MKFRSPAGKLGTLERHCALQPTDQPVAQPADLTLFSVAHTMMVNSLAAVLKDASVFLTSPLTWHLYNPVRHWLD